DGEGTYTVSPDGTVTFTPEPTFTGTGTGVTVKRVDKNGTAVTAKYTPTVEKVTPTGADATSTGKQGQVQSGQPTFTAGDPLVPMDDNVAATFDDGSTTKTIDGEGTYTVAQDGTVTFTPEPTFTGTGTGVIVKRVDKNGTEVTAKYTPTVEKVTPTAQTAETTGKQGQAQTTEARALFTAGDVTAPIDSSTITLLDVNNQPVTTVAAMKDGQEVGTYSIDPATGVVTFQPNLDFVGTPDAVKIQAKDKNGTAVETTYTPTVEAVTPTGSDATSTGKQGQVQSGQPTFTAGDPLVPMDDNVAATFEDGNTTKTIDGEGTYTVAQDGTVTFTPEPTFTGTGTGVTVKRVDKNGTAVTAKYTPTVEKVTPTAQTAETTGKQGQAQTTEARALFTAGDVTAPIDSSTITLLDVNNQPVTTVAAMKDGQEVGTYSIDPVTGVVTFQPNLDFVGTPDAVKIQAKDKNGTSVETTYTPTVEKVTPTGADATSTGKQGQVQTATPTFVGGDSSVPIDDTVPATFDDGSTTKTIDGEGTYTVAPDGTVTFTPEPTFTGTGTGVTVKRVDKNGTVVTAKYVPTVEAVTPTGEDATSTGKQGQVQTATPTFVGGDPSVPIDDTVPATFKDGSTEMTIDGEGTYSVAPDGTVTFTPEPTFTGTGTGVIVKRVDKNGTEVTAKYTPTVEKVTPTAQTAETTGKQGQAQTTEARALFTAGDVTAPIDSSTITLLDVNNQPATTVPAMKDGQEVGTYSID
ncbi:CshA family fibrillar surface protein C, partial [Streptococcus sp. CSL10205-OR2]|nr:CshA family fibrillar surface protein C [Streptococcus sp. CSL10205-OR2]